MALWGINKYFCVSLQGGVNDEVTLAAYITIALLEIPLPVTVRVRTPTRATDGTNLPYQCPHAQIARSLYLWREEILSE